MRPCARTGPGPALHRLRFLCLAVLLAAGCRSVPAPPLQGVPVPADDPQLLGVLDALDRAARERTSMRGTLRLSVDAPDLRLRATQRVVARRPAELRVEILGLFSQVAAVLTTDGARFELIEASGRRESGWVTPDLLWNVARVDLRPDEVVGLLLGAPGGGDGWRIEGAERSEDGTLFVRLADGRNRARRLRVDGAGRLVGDDRFDGDQLAWRARFAEHREVEGHAFADRVDLEFPRTGASAVVQFKAVELNPELPSGLFLLRSAERVSSRAGVSSR